MAEKDAPAAVAGSTTTVKTMADGTLRVSVDIEPRNAQAAFAMFGAPGTPVAIARLTAEAAVAEGRREQIQAAAEAKPDHGKHYEVLYRMGWWNNPAVKRGLGFAVTSTPEDLKAYLYSYFHVTSLSQVEPSRFVGGMTTHGLVQTLPRGFGEGA